MLIVMGLVSPLAAQIEVHGISFTKGAVSPVQVGDPYESGFVISNTVDTALDTLHVTALVDTVHASAGDVNSGNILSALTWTFNGGAQFIGVNHLELPPGSSVSSLANPFSFYTTVTGDFFLPNHVLVDTAVITWHDTCDGNSTNCNELERNSDTVSQATVTAPLPCLDVEKTVDCAISAPGQIITHHITITNCGPGPLTKSAIFDTVSGIGDISISPPASCDALDPNQSCSFDVDFTVPDPFPGVGIENIVSAVYTDTFQQQVDANDSVSVCIIHPDFTVTKSCLTDPLQEGQSALFNITITNTGDIPLDFTTNEPCLPASFQLQPGGVTNVEVSRPFDSNGVFNSITVDANLPDDLCFQLPSNIVKEANDRCDVEGGATRTLGFWKTHCEYTEHVFTVHCGGSISLGWIPPITNINDLLGVLFANPAKTSGGAKRDALCQARVITSKQAVAALLNNCLDNGATLPKTPAEIAAILAGTNKTAIKQLGELLDVYNNSGDDITIIDDDGFLFGRATPRVCAASARVGVVDCTSSQRTTALRLGR